MTNPSEEIVSDDQSLDFAIPIGTGMRRVPAGAGAEFDAETTERLRNRLEEFDAVRTRGEIESRSVHLGGHSPR
jgi:hypothetical protein